MSGIDWSSYPEPWRSIGRDFAVEAAEIARGSVARHTMPWSAALRYLLRSLRKARGLTQVALGRQLGVSDTVISAWETARNYPRPESRAAMRTFFGVDI